MIRWTFRTLLCLLLGVVTTVAVAWGLAWCVDLGHPRITLRDAWAPLEELGFDAPGFMSVHIVGASGSTIVEAFVGDFYHWPESAVTMTSPMKIIPKWCETRVLNSPAMQGDAEESKETFFLVATGWPFVGLWCEPAMTGAFNFRVQPAIGGIALSGEGYSLAPINTLPLRPILPGFLIDTLFYAVIWFGLFFGIGGLRRTIRKKRGWCEKCGYDLRGTPGGSAAGCSECGWGREN